MKRTLVYLSSIAVLALGVGASFALAGNPHGTPPGQGECSHGATGKECKPDPQPDHGKDCEKHGKNGGVNEDHCKGETTTTPTTPTDTTPTTPTDTVPTTPTETTPTTPTDTTTTTTETTSETPSVPVAPPVETTPVTATTVVVPAPSVKKKVKVKKVVLKHKPDKPKKVKIVKVAKPTKDGLVKIKLSNGKTVTGVMGSG